MAWAHLEPVEIMVTFLLGVIVGAIGVYLIRITIAEIAGRYRAARRAAHRAECRRVDNAYGRGYEQALADFQKTSARPFTAPPRAAAVVPSLPANAA